MADGHVEEQAQTKAFAFRDEASRRYHSDYEPHREELPKAENSPQKQKLGADFGLDIDFRDGTKTSL